MSFRVCGNEFKATKLSLFFMMLVVLLLAQMSLITKLWTSSSRNRELTKNNYITEYLFSKAANKHTTNNFKITSLLSPTTDQLKKTTGSTVAMASSSSPGSSSSIRRVSTTKAKDVVDMENDYYPFVNFSFVWPETKPILPPSRKPYMLVALINSGARGDKYRARRRAIRETWGRKTCEQIKRTQNYKHEWLLLFSLGKTYSFEDKANINEAKKNNDMLIGDFEDIYINNVIKIYMGHLWVSTKQVRYILKTDDDVYVRIPATIDWLVQRQLPTRFYGGDTYLKTGVERDPRGKWAVSKKYFNETYFPPFNAGAFYILSTDTLSELSNYVNIKPPFHTDDAYIGVAARDLKINVTRISGFLVQNHMKMLINGYNDCHLVTLRAFGHNLEPDALRSLHNRLESICIKNKTRSC